MQQLTCKNRRRQTSRTVVCSPSLRLRVSACHPPECVSGSVSSKPRSQLTESKTFYIGGSARFALFNLYRSAIVLYAKIESAFLLCVRGKCARSVVGTIFFSRNNFHCISVLVPRGKQRKSDVISKQLKLFFL